jgi:hypothetical protein
MIVDITSITVEVEAVSEAGIEEAVVGVEVEEAVVRVERGITGVGKEVEREVEVEIGRGVKIPEEKKESSRSVQKKLQIFLIFLNRNLLLQQRWLPLLLLPLLLRLIQRPSR